MRSRRRIAAAQLHLVREIDGRGMPVAQHASSSAVWLREHLRIGIQSAKRLVDLARAVDERPVLDSALAAGVINVEQAAVVAAAVQDLPAQLGQEVVDRAEAVLIEQAGRYEPAILRKAGQRILAHVAPELIPAVLGGEGQVLDLGRSRRLITGPLRRALELRDRGCAFPGCDRPPRWWHGHHIRGWVEGGATSLDNSVLLCGHHHRVIHRGHWTVRLDTDRMPVFIPPTYVDPRQRPRGNLYHHRT